MFYLLFSVANDIINVKLGDNMQYLLKHKKKEFLITTLILFIIQFICALFINGVEVAVISPLSAFIAYLIFTIINQKNKKLANYSLLGILSFVLIYELVLCYIAAYDYGNFSFFIDFIFSSYFLVELVVIICLHEILLKNKIDYNKILLAIYLHALFENIKFLNINIHSLIHLINNGLMTYYFYNYHNQKIKKFDYKEWIPFAIMLIILIADSLGIIAKIPLGSLFVYILTMGLLIYISKKEKENKKKEFMIFLQKDKEEKAALSKEKQEYDKKSLKILKKYQKEKYDINDDETNEIICRSYNITKKELLELYNRGLEIIEEEKNAEMYSKRQEEILMFEEEKAKTNIYGKEKYLSVLKPRLEAMETIQKMSSIMSESYISGAEQAKNVKEKDPYFWGGMANGLAGPAIGLMEASRIQTENEKRKAEAKIVSQNSLDSAKRWANEASKARRTTVSLRRMIELINDALYIDDINKIKDNIEFKSVKYEITDANNFIVIANCELSNLKILNKPALVDGILKIKILDNDDKLIAVGYYSPDNIEVTESADVYIEELGFKNKFKSMCITENGVKVSKEKKYHIDIEPIKLWMIEKNWE